MNLITDGAPRALPHIPTDQADSGRDLPHAAPEAASGWRSTLASIRYAEGARGVAERQAVILRWAAQLGAVVAAAAVVEWSFAGTRWGSATSLLLAAVTVIFVTAAAGCVFMAHDRKTVLDQFRHFLFSLCVIPASVIAIFCRLLRGYVADPANQDNFTSMLSGSLPYVYAFTTLMSAVVFVKTISGMRTIARSTMDDQEAISLWTRNDGLYV